MCAYMFMLISSWCNRPGKNVESTASNGLHIGFVRPTKHCSADVEIYFNLFPREQKLVKTKDKAANW